ncbi:MAG: YHS domain-containing protein [Bacteroidota bacterium]
MKSILFAAFCLFMMVSCQNASKPASTGSNAPATAAAAIHFDNKTDLSCGMEVTPEFTDSCHYKGKVYGFCSESCKETFLGDPEKYLSGK